MLLNLNIVDLMIAFYATMIPAGFVVSLVMQHYRQPFQKLLVKTADKLILASKDDGKNDRNDGMPLAA